MSIKQVHKLLRNHTGFIFAGFFVVALLACYTLTPGMTSASNNEMGSCMSTHEVICSKTEMLGTTAVSHRDGLFGGLLLLLIIGLSAGFLTFARKYNHDTGQGLLGAPPRFSEFIAKLYNPLLEAFRRGILHPQIYGINIIA